MVGVIGKQFGRHLRAVRRSLGLRQLDLQNLSGVSLNTIADIERGDRAPSWATAVMLARALNVSLDDFVPADFAKIVPSSH